MTNSKDFFTDLDLRITGHVQLAEVNKRSEVRGRGSGAIKCIVDGRISKLYLKNVLYVPSFGSNLISVKRLTKEGHGLNFLKDGCKIVKNGEIKGIATVGPAVEDVYELQVVGKIVCTAIKVEHGDNCQHIWHRRFGHQDFSAIKNLAEKGLATGINIKDCGKREECECCIQAKMTRPPFPKESRSKTQAILDLLHTDICGPMQTMTLGKKRYLMTVIDDYSRYTAVYFLKTKDEAAVRIKEFVEMAKTQYNKTPKYIRSDRGREYVNKDLQDYLNKQGIKVQYTAAYSPQQNGVAERKNRSLIEMAKCMLLDANLNNAFWAEAERTANFLQNRLPTKATGKTPYELWNKKKPDVRYLHIFGCDAYVQIPKEQRRKLDDKAEKLTFLGYSEESKAFRFFDRKNKKLKVSRDVIFLDSNKNQFKLPGDAEYSEYTFNKNCMPELEEDRKIGSEGDSFEESSVEEPEYISGIDSDNSESQEDRRPATELRRSARNNRGVPPDRYMASSKLAKEDPRSRKEALSGLNKEEWRKAD